MSKLPAYLPVKHDMGGAGEFFELWGPWEDHGTRTEITLTGGESRDYVIKLAERLNRAHAKSPANARDFAAAVDKESRADLGLNETVAVPYSVMMPNGEDRQWSPPGQS